MSDHDSNTAREDTGLVNIHDENEVEFWTGNLGYSREELVAAVTKVGVSTFLVETELRTRTNA